MNNVPSSAIMTIVAIVATVFVGTFIFVAVSSQMDTQQSAQTDANKQMNYTAELRYTQYENEDISGARVQDVLQSYLGDDISLRVKPLTPDTSQSNYRAADSMYVYGNDYADASKHTGAVALSADKTTQNGWIKSQVKTGSRYRGEIQRDASGGITGLIFNEVTSMTSTTGSDPKNLTPSGGNSGSSSEDGKTYAIRLYTNGGTISSSGWTGPDGTGENMSYSKSYTSGVTSSVILPTPTKQNYTFLGWSENGKIHKGSYSLKDVSGDVPLVAEWERTQYTITYKNAVDGADAVSVSTPSGNPAAYAGGDIVSLVAPSLPGKTFDGWTITYQDSTGATHTTAKDKAAVINGYTGNVIATAYFTTSYTITYDLGDGGFGTKAINNNPETYTSSDKITLQEPTWAEHKFIGWTGSNGTTPQKSVTISNRTGNLKFKANWTNAVSTLTLSANGGEFTKGPNLSAGATTLTVTVASGTSYTFSDVAVSRDGYTFSGWKQTSGAGSGTVYPPSKGPGNVSEDASYQAVWTETKYTIIAHSNIPTGDTKKTFSDISYTKNTASSLASWIASLNYKGGTLTGWNTKADGTGTSYSVDNVQGVSKNGGTVELYAQYKSELIYISYRSNAGGKSVTGSMSQQAVEYGKTFSLSENGFGINGYKFTGWNTKADGTGTAYANGQTFNPTTKTPAYPANASMTLYAQWSANAVVVTLDPNGGKLNTTTAVLNVDYALGKTYKDTNLKNFVPTKTGYTFDGWYPEMEGGTKVTDNTPVPSGNITLYAHWTTNRYQIKFDGNGSTSGTTAAMTVSYDTDVVLNSNAFAKTGYVFAGWNTKADGKGTAYKNQATVRNLVSAANGSITLYAQWTSNKYEIRFRPNGGDGNMNVMTVTYDQKVDLTNKFTNDGYTFLGWATSPDETVRENLFGTSSIKVQDLAKACGISTTDGGTITLYAVWGMNYTWSYKLDNGRHYLTVVSANNKPSSVNWWDDTKYSLGAYNKRDFTDSTYSELNEGVAIKKGGTIGGEYTDDITYAEIDAQNTIVALVDQERGIAGSVDIGIDLTSLKKAQDECEIAQAPPQYKNKVVTYQKGNVQYLFVREEAHETGYTMALVKYIGTYKAGSNPTCTAQISYDGGKTYKDTKTCTISDADATNVTYVATCHYTINGIDIECHANLSGRSTSN